MQEYLVIDMGGTFIKYAIMDETTAIKEKSKIPSPSIEEGTIEELFAGLDPIADRYRSEVHGIAISMPGMLDDRTGFAKTSGALKFLLGHNIRDLFTGRYHLPVSVQNDGKAAALAEHWKGALKDCANGAVVIIGTGIGGGLIINNQLLVGRDFSAGEFSFMNINETNNEFEQGFWNKYGHVGLSRLLASETGEDYKSLDGIEVFRRVRADDAQAIHALKQFCRGHAIQIYNLSILLDLELVAIGGGLSEDPLLIEYLNEAILDYRAALPFGAENDHLPIAKIVPCQFHSDANLIGALYHHRYGTWEKGNL